MGKTRDDEIHEKGVRDGQRGIFLDDFIQGNFKSRSREEQIYNKGYEYGVAHRYGPEGRYHSWSNAGSNDPKKTNDVSVSADDYDGEFVGGLIAFVLAIAVIAYIVSGIGIGLNYLTEKVEVGIIQSIYPAYETREEQALREKQEWQRWENFAQGSKKWLLISEITPTMPEEKLVFVTQTNGKQLIYLTNLENGSQAELTKELAGEITDYTISPNGKMIAFILNQDGNSEIYITSTNGNSIFQSGRIFQLTKEINNEKAYPYQDLSWLSHSVILTTKQIHPYVKTIWQVLVIPNLVLREIPATSSMRIPTLHEFNEEWTQKAKKGIFYECSKPMVTMDSTRLVYIKTTSRLTKFGFNTITRGTNEIVVKELKNDKQFTVYSNNNTISLTSQSWSPNGNKIVFSVRDKDGKNKIGILELKKTIWSLSRAKISWLRITGNNPAWSPDGKWIAFDNQEEAYIFEIATGNIRRVAKGTKPLWFP